MKTNMTIARLILPDYPQQQTARANVMVNLKSVNKLPNTRVSLQLKNGWLEVQLELVALFLFTGNLRC